MEPLLHRERRLLYRLEMYFRITVVLWKYTNIVKVIRDYDWTCWKILKSSKYIYLKLDLLYNFQQIPKIWESNCGILWCSAWLSHQLWSYAFSEWRHLPLLYLHWYNIYLVQLQLTKYHHLPQIFELILPWRIFLLFTFYFCPLPPLDCAMYQATLVIKTENFIMVSCLLENHALTFAILFVKVGVRCWSNNICM